jgi:hypothetical protein
MEHYGIGVAHSAYAIKTLLTVSSFLAETTQVFGSREWLLKTLIKNALADPPPVKLQCLHNLF